MADAVPPQLVRKLKLYQTKAQCYLVGRTQDKRSFRICKFSRLEVSLPGSISEHVKTASTFSRILFVCISSNYYTWQGRELQALQDPSVYTEAQCQRILNSIDAGNTAHGGLNLILEVRDL